MKACQLSKREQSLHWGSSGFIALPAPSCSVQSPLAKGLKSWRSRRLVRPCRDFRARLFAVSGNRKVVLHMSDILRTPMQETFLT